MSDPSQSAIVFLDANILASCATATGRIRDWWLGEHQEQFVTSPEALTEALLALHSSRLGDMTANQLQGWLAEICAGCRVIRRDTYWPVLSMPVNAPREDWHILEAAVSAGSSILVSGDSGVLALESFHGVKIQRFRDFVDGA